VWPTIFVFHACATRLPHASSSGCVPRLRSTSCSSIVVNYRNACCPFLGSEKKKNRLNMPSYDLSNMHTWIRPAHDAGVFFWIMALWSGMLLPHSLSTESGTSVRYISYLSYLKRSEKKSPLLRSVAGESWRVVKSRVVLRLRITFWSVERERVFQCERRPCFLI
jgi:hypothetical protein